MEGLMLQHKGSRPHIRFETRPIEDRAASIEAGRKVYVDIDWVIITPPGGKDVREDHAEAWLAKIKAQSEVGQYDFEWVDAFKKMYAMYKEGKELPEDGTPLRMCTTLFSPAEIANCLGVNIRTLEDLAGATEEALGRLGMGARALKTRAQTALNTGDGKEAAMRVEALEVENSSLKERVADLTAVVNELKEQMATMMPLEHRRGPGRPPKQEGA
ncbi:hypothetical protein [Burkholderia sp. B21-005]|uniref:hypothetical protein n=1 Tax=Burkholderia sp. B21-005 TaxID=2890406 RepID=UPI001E62AC13|nr:hypothetical protein [Burkholderia sp. B21-005]UEP43145.1 hypothetical protein LMA02_24035 [Burkholderia sp. B21-005]